MIRFKHFLWTIPFICFLGSYCILHCLLATNALLAPSLIGKNLQEAVQILSDYNLNARIISQKEDNDLAPGTILSQMPAAHRKIRPHQSIFFVVSKKTVQKTTPSFLQKNKTDIEQMAKEQGISLKLHYLASHHPENSCIGQLPAPQEPLPDHRMTAYLSSGSTSKLVILPSFKKRPITEVGSFLTEQGIKFNAIHAKPIDTSHNCKHCIVVDQKPLVGSLINLKKPLTIQLFVQ